MPTLTLGTAGNYTWYLDYTTTQSVVNNQSTIAYTLRIHRNVSSTNGAFWGTPARSFNVTINGVSDTENFSSIDFRAAADINFTSGSVVIAHNADGTKSPVSVSAAVTGSYVSAGFPVPTTLSGLTISLATIPRAATSITRTSGTETGSASVLAVSPLVSSFYYVLKYKSPLTGSWTTIGPSGGIVGTSWPYSNTVGHGEIPDAGSGTVQYQVTTLDGSGGTQIGTPVEASFTYTVPASVLPVVGAPTWTEGATDTGLSTLTNGGAVFCQGWSKLVPTFSSTPGTGASIASAVATVAGVSGTTTSGVAFANRITTQGVGATFSAVATDSRGRTDTETGTVSPSVHRWALPTASAGTPVVTPTSTTQTIALSGLSATTTSFFLSASQRNVLETRVGYRDLTTAGAWVYGSWTAQALSGSDSTDNAYAPGSPLTVATGLDPTHEYEVTLQVRDIFGKNAVNYSNGLPYVESSFIVSAQNVLIAFDGNTRVGIKKVPVNGALDIAGDVYADEFYAGGNQLARVNELPSAASTTVAGLVERATDAETQTGTDATRYVSPASLSARTATTTRTGVVELATNAETITGTDSARAVTPAGLTSALDKIHTDYVTFTGGAFNSGIGNSGLVWWGELTVSFGQTFVEPPSVVVYCLTTGAVMYGVVLSITTTGFTFRAVRLQAALATGFSYAYAVVGRLA